MPVARVSHKVIEIVGAASGKAEVSQRVVEVLFARPTPSPTTVTGAGVSQRVVEVLFASTTDARVSHRAIEVLMTAAGTNAPGGGGEPGGGSGDVATTSFGYAT